MISQSNNSLRAERYAKFQTKIQTWNQRIANDEPNGDNPDLIGNSIDRYTTNRLMHENHCQPQMQAKNKSPTCSICPKFAVFKQIQKVGRENTAERRNIFSCGSKSDINAPVF